MFPDEALTVFDNYYIYTRLAPALVSLQYKHHSLPRISVTHFARGFRERWLCTCRIDCIVWLWLVISIDLLWFVAFKHYGLCICFFLYLLSLLIREKWKLITKFRKRKCSVWLGHLSKCLILVFSSRHGDSYMTLPPPWLGMTAEPHF